MLFVCRYFPAYRSMRPGYDLASFSSEHDSSMGSATNSFRLGNISLNSVSLSSTGSNVSSGEGREEYNGECDLLGNKPPNASSCSGIRRQIRL